MSPITTHVLDTALGRPAQGIAVTLDQKDQKDRDDRHTWTTLGQGVTDPDGRIRDLIAGDVAAGVYRITFHTDAYFQARGVDSFYPEVTIVFRVAAPGEHYHVPLLLSPFGYSTYRGS